MSHPSGKLIGSCIEAVFAFPLGCALVLSCPSLACTQSARQTASPAACLWVAVARLLFIIIRVAPPLRGLPCEEAGASRGSAESVSPDGLTSGLSCGACCSLRCPEGGSPAASAALHSTMTSVVAAWPRQRMGAATPCCDHPSRLDQNRRHGVEELSLISHGQTQARWHKVCGAGGSEMLIQSIHLNEPFTAGLSAAGCCHMCMRLAHYFDAAQLSRQRLRLL